jgi:hypothetical protein
MIVETASTPVVVSAVAMRDEDITSSRTENHWSLTREVVASRSKADTSDASGNGGRSVDELSIPARTILRSLDMVVSCASSAEISVVSSVCRDAEIY